jgi:hypothetical protein
MNATKISGIFILFFAVFCVWSFYFFYWGRNHYALFFSGQKSQGTVIGNQPMKTCTKSLTCWFIYQPIIQFTTQNQESHTFISQFHPGSASHIGEVLTVDYNPDHPDQAIVDDPSGMQQETALWAVLTSFLIIAGIIQVKMRSS